MRGVTYAGHHRSHGSGKDVVHELEDLGVRTCTWNGTRRRRRLWRLADCDNGLAYWDAPGCVGLVPVCRVDELED